MTTAVYSPSGNLVAAALVRFTDGTPSFISQFGFVAPPVDSGVGITDLTLSNEIDDSESAVQATIDHSGAAAYVTVVRDGAVPAFLQILTADDAGASADVNFWVTVWRRYVG